MRNLIGFFMTDEPSGHRNVRRSVAAPGEMADRPDGDGITAIEVSDTNDDPAGFLIEWKHRDNSTWIYAEAGSYGEIRL